MNRYLKAVIFDLGQTLTLNSMAAAFSSCIGRGVQDELLKNGYRISLPKLGAIAGSTFWAMHKRGKRIGCDYRDHEILDVVFRRLGLQASLVPEVLSRIYEESYNVVKVSIEGRQAIEDIAEKGYKLGILTNGEYPSSYVWEILRKGNISQYIDALVVSCEERMRKPNPQLFYRICDEMDVTPKEAVYVGDSYKKDVLGALGVEMQAIWYIGEHKVPHFWLPKEVKSGQVRIVRDLRDIIHQL